MKRKLYKVTAFLMAVLLSCAIEPCVMAEGGAVIIVSTPEDFAALCKNCVYDSYSRGMSVTLDRDIDMSGVEFEPMKIFCGTFEGGGHRISNLKLDFEGSAKGMCFELGQGGEIRNLNVSGEVKAKKESEAATTVGEIIGSVAKNAGISSDLLDKDNKASVLGGIVGTNSGRIINCSFSGSVEGEAAVGGIVGENRDGGYIEACYNVSSVVGDEYAGGIAGRNYGWIKSSKNEGSVNAVPIEDSHNIGGIVGLNEGVAEGCINSAEIGYKNVGINIGGIAGKQSGCLLECENKGNVLGAKGVGGIFGRFEPYTEITAENLDELRQNIKDDVDDTRQNVKNDIDSYQKRLNTDVNNVLDRFGSLRSGTGLIGGLSRLGDVADGVKDAVDVISDDHSVLVGDLRDAANSADSNLTEFTDSMTDLLDTLDDTVGSATHVSGTLNTLVGDMDDLVNDINDAYNSGDRETLDDRLNSLSDRLDYLQDDILYPISGSVNSAMNSLTKTLNSLRSDSNYLSNAIGAPLYRLEAALEDIDDMIDSLDEDIENIKQEISDFKDKIHDSVGGLFPSSSDKPSRIGKVISDMIFMNAYADDVIKLSDEEIRSELKNVTDVDVSTPRDVSGMPTDNAVVIYCINSGSVSGESGVGGIGGTVGVESAVRNGKDLTLPSGKVLNASSIVKAVINGCIAEGEISSKNGYVGGIVGDANFGTVKNSAARVNIDSEEGTYLGGVAGYTGGKIEKSIAIADLNGKSNVGGIAGVADEISLCYALPRISTKPEKSGAITGSADGVILNNYFIKEGLSGINGADFDGKAVALEWYEITGTDTIPEKMSGFEDKDWYMGSGDIYLPQNRVLSDNSASSIGALIKSKSADFANFHFKVEFVIDGKTEKEMVVDYATVLDKEEIPELEIHDGYCPQWDKDTDAPIVRNTKFNAEYIDAIRTIGTSEEPPLLLVDGNFRDNAKVSAWETEFSEDFEGYAEVGAYDFEITPEYNGKIKVHIRDKEGKGDYIGIVRDGKTRVLNAERDGSYLVFELDEPQSFAVLHKKSHAIEIVGITMITLGLICLIFVFAKKRMKK